MRHARFTVVAVLLAMGAGPSTRPTGPVVWVAAPDTPRSVLQFLEDAPKIGERSRGDWSEQIVQIKKEREEVVAAPIPAGSSSSVGAGWGTVDTVRSTPNIGAEAQQHMQIEELDRQIVNLYANVKASKQDLWLPSAIPDGYPVGSYMIVPDGPKIVTVDKEKSSFVSKLDNTIYGLTDVDVSDLIVGDTAPSVGFCQVVGKMTYKNARDGSVAYTAYALVPVDLRLYLRPSRGFATVPGTLVAKIRVVVLDQTNYVALLRAPAKIAESSGYIAPDDPLSATDDPTSASSFSGGGPDYIGPRGGVYHYSDNGNKVYSSHGGGGHR